MNTPGIVIHSAAQEQLKTFLTAPTHALLLTGPTGGGKTHVAVSLASQLLGVDDPANSAYYRIVTSQKGSISIEQIRELITFFRLKVPGTAKIKRVAIIQDADEMGTEAQNALLKLLEEPPIDSVLLLTSSHPQTLLSTIRSRLQSLQLPSPGAEALNKHFTKLGYKNEEINTALLRSGSNIAEAHRLLTQGSDGENPSITLVKQALGGTSYERLLLVEGLVKQKEAAIEFVNTLATVAMVSLEASAKRGNPSLLRWKSVLQAAHTAQRALERSGNVKLVLTELMLDM